MKKLVVLTLCFCFLMMAEVYAEETMKNGYILQNLDVIHQWGKILTAKRESITDEDSLFILEQVINDLNEVEAVILNSSYEQEQKSTFESEQKLLAGFQYKEYANGDTEIQTAACLAPSGLRYVCRTNWGETYFKLGLYSFDKKDNLANWQCVEAAQKGDALLLLEKMYNQENHLTSYFATWVRGDDASTIYTQFFGTEEDIILKPKDWAEGKLNIEDWNEDLLLPVH